jgi:hypothetical protein
MTIPKDIFNQTLSNRNSLFEPHNDNGSLWRDSIEVYMVPAIFSALVV